MDILTQLIALKPISTASASKAYNIYKDPDGNSCITYTQLSNTLEVLIFDHFVMDSSNNVTMFYRLDNEMKW